MGDPKKLKKKYISPAHPWIRTAIDENKIFKREYGLLKRKEILISSSFLKKYKDIAKKLIANYTAQGEREKAQMMNKLQRYGLLHIGASLDDVLSIQLKDVLERRLQSLVLRKGMARSMEQARQFITHRHISIGNKEITSPSYMLTVEEESSLVFKPTSALANGEHPERTGVTAETVKVIEAEKNKLRESAELRAKDKARGGRSGGRFGGKFSPRKERSAGLDAKKSEALKKIAPKSKGDKK